MILKKKFKNTKFYSYALNTMKDFNLEPLINARNLKTNNPIVHDVEKRLISEAYNSSKWIFTDVESDFLSRRTASEIIFELGVLLQLSHGRTRELSSISSLEVFLDTGLFPWEPYQNN
ncbi:hypothetical protein WOSG25_110090 [Weissella oryzae SG25]|uniref:Uncharacterized protein n=1 Tax=Weissella oryzae (strain DSM 25784 / JCM 18191 / LMG 30913 / SG25) TaxID=1329250 RepID=A0A069D297_WEIOS|nr:hypothetical protein [Weissella oryzae]GAK31531.1 hypothetical protein WOSG25_110090 [Weissella oryzae SG25]